MQFLFFYVDHVLGREENPLLSREKGKKRELTVMWLMMF